MVRIRRSVLAIFCLSAGVSVAGLQIEEAARAPIPVPGITNAAAAAIGDHFYVVLKQDGTVMTWGYNHVGQLGNGAVGKTSGSEPGQTLPYVVDGTARLVPGLSEVISVAAGSEHVLVVKRDGSVWGWGSNGDGQLGLGRANVKPVLSPVRVPGIEHAKAVAAYSSSSYALLEDGTVVGWGDRLWRTGSRAASSEKPLPVPGLKEVAQIRAGLPCLALRRDGSVMAWGTGFLGDGSPAQRDYAAPVVPQPAKVQGIDDAVAIATGSDTSAVIRRDGSVWIWGAGGSGHLGLGRGTAGGSPDQMVPVRMPGLPAAVDIALASGSSIVFADGTLRTWGDARLGATGRTGIDRVFTPAAVPGVRDLVHVWGHAYSNLGLTRDGRMLAWGSVYVAKP